MSNSVISRPEELIPVFSPCDPLYQDYFNLFLTHTNQKSRSWVWFEKEVLPTINHEVMIDLGAGNGELLKHFIPFFQQCFAVEPNPDFQKQLLDLIPLENYFQTTISDAPDSIPKADLIVASHVKYYLPKSEWNLTTQRAMSWLKPDGCLVETLNSQYSDLALMITHFIGQEYVKELQNFAWQYSHEQNIEVKVDTREAWIECESLEEMLKIAIFMMNDLPSEVLIRHRPNRQELADWVSQYYFEGCYRMSCLEDFVQYRYSMP